MGADHLRLHAYFAEDGLWNDDLVGEGDHRAVTNSTWPMSLVITRI
jgi:hypothetical protein